MITKKYNIIKVLALFASTMFAQDTNTVLISGVFIHDKGTYYEQNQNKTNNSVVCYFVQTPTTSINLNAIDKVNWVRYNGVKLKYNGSSKIYSKRQKVNNNSNHDDDNENDNECNTLNFSLKNWIVKGKNYIPDMNFNYNGVAPNISFVPNLLPDSLKKSDTLKISIGNITNCDSIIVTIADSDQLSNRHFVAFKSPNYTSELKINPSIFSPLIQGNRGFIKIELVSYNTQVVAGKNYSFIDKCSYTKPNIQIIN
ncbi:MAG: hypothetical protein LCH32_13865 [Bacteroidetes bacterium]|nr:hypothetical protein [Bacteroidota bacterium]